MKKITTKSSKSAKSAAPPSGAASAAAPPVKKPAAKTTSTKITAQFDVGFGNTLYVRGEGPGLSWDRGLAMDCVSDDEWTITLSDATVPVTFKVLLNDITWCVGNDYVVEAGGTTVVVPSF